jgi:hypothetical protein
MQKMNNFTFVKIARFVSDNIKESLKDANTLFYAIAVYFDFILMKGDITDNGNYPSGSIFRSYIPQGSK